MLPLVALLGIATSPYDLIDQAIQAEGGAALLGSIQTVTSKGMSHTYLVEQSERPEGPFLANYAEYTETCDFGALTRSVEQQLKGAVYNRPITLKFQFSDGKITGQAFPDENCLSARRLALGPERILLLAKASSDLRSAGQTKLQSVPHDVLEFTWGKYPVRLYLNHFSKLPTAVDTLQPGTGFWTIWGDVSWRTVYGNWELKKGGLRYPLQWVDERNGIRLSETTLLSVSVETGPGAPSFQQPMIDTQAGWATPTFRPTEVSPGVHYYDGPYSTTVVEQTDGLVVIEGVISSDFTAAFWKYLERTFPGKPVKAVITTTDAWPHIGGLRTYMARQVPIIINPLNRPILERLAKATFTYRPDELQRSRKSPVFKPVTKRLVIGDGSERVEVYPLNNEGSERMLMVYLPGAKVLYGSDLIQPMPNGELFFPQYPDELRQAVEREHLEVLTVFAMHSPPRPWQQVLDAISKAKSG